MCALFPAAPPCWHASLSIWECEGGPFPARAALPRGWAGAHVSLLGTRRCAVAARVKAVWPWLGQVEPLPPRPTGWPRWPSPLHLWLAQPVRGQPGRNLAEGRAAAFGQRRYQLVGGRRAERSDPPSSGLASTQPVLPGSVLLLCAPLCPPAPRPLLRTPRTPITKPHRAPAQNPPLCPARAPIGALAASPSAHIRRRAAMACAPTHVQRNTGTPTACLAISPSTRSRGSSSAMRRAALARLRAA